jgi:hypothetical protein
MKLSLIADHKTGFHLRNYLSLVLGYLFFFKKRILIKNLTFYSRNLELSDQHNHKYIIFIRDPKKIILSSYYYHLKCRERWCLIPNNINNYIALIYGYEKNALLDVVNNFLKSDLIINSKSSYQKILQDLSESEGLKYDFLKSSIFTIYHMEVLLKNLDYDKHLVVDCERFTNNPTVDFKRIKMRLFPNLNTDRITKIYERRLDMHKKLYNNHKTDASKKVLPDFINNIYQEKFPELDNLYNKVINLSYLNNN